MEEFKAPTLEQFHEFIRCFFLFLYFNCSSLFLIIILIRIYVEADAKKEGVAVHCRGGNGRTVTVESDHLIIKMIMINDNGLLIFSLKVPSDAGCLFGVE